MGGRDISFTVVILEVGGRDIRFTVVIVDMGRRDIRFTVDDMWKWVVGILDSQ